MTAPQTLTTTCCIVGGGPAGVMLGFLLARAGVDVTVLEKHGDFFRDFRGDTIHPSTLELLSELGLLEDFLKLPHQQYSNLTIEVNGRTLQGPDFSHLPTHCKFIALAPQWDFLNFLAAAGREYSGFHLLMNTNATGFIEENGAIVGVKAVNDAGEVEIRSDLVVGADGRHAISREQAGLKVDEFGVPIDVLWYRLPKRGDDAVSDALGRISNGKMMVTLDRGDYFQCGTIIPKGNFPEIQARGLPAFRDVIREIVPGFSEKTVNELHDWNQIKLLTVQLNRLEHWQRPGLLCIGDAAHAMSPAGGVGVNIAIQDAVATANLLAEKLRTRTLTFDDLVAVQRYREGAVKKTQNLQSFMHARLFSSNKGFGQTALFSTPVRWILTPVGPRLRRLAGTIIGLGFQPEHIQTPERK